MLSAAAREIGAGHLDRRLEPETADEFGSLVEAFNSMALLRDLSGGDYPAKPAYQAYATLAHQLAEAIPIGVGPVHTHVYDPRADRGNENEIYDYRYTRDTTTIDVLWRTTTSRAPL